MGSRARAHMVGIEPRAPRKKGGAPTSRSQWPYTLFLCVWLRFKVKIDDVTIDVMGQLFQHKKLYLFRIQFEPLIFSNMK